MSNRNKKAATERARSLFVAAQQRYGKLYITLIEDLLDTVAHPDWDFTEEEANEIVQQVIGVEEDKAIREFVGKLPGLAAELGGLLLSCAYQAASAGKYAAVAQVIGQLRELFGLKGIDYRFLSNLTHQKLDEHIETLTKPEKQTLLKLLRIDES